MKYFSWLHNDNYMFCGCGLSCQSFVWLVGWLLCVWQASLKVADSEWSDKFSLDTVGSAGTVSCKFKGYNFEVCILYHCDCVLCCVHSIICTYNVCCLRTMYNDWQKSTVGELVVSSVNIWVYNVVCLLHNVLNCAYNVLIWAYTVVCPVYNVLNWAYGVVCHMHNGLICAYNVDVLCTMFLTEHTMFYYMCTKNVFFYCMLLYSLYACSHCIMFMSNCFHHKPTSNLGHVDPILNQAALRLAGLSKAFGLARTLSELIHSHYEMYRVTIQMLYLKRAYSSRS